MPYRRSSGVKYSKSSRSAVTGKGNVVTKPRGPTGGEGGDLTVNVGTTTTGEPETSAIVTNSGTETDAVLNFTIPRGKDGDDGQCQAPNFTVHGESGDNSAAYISGSYPSLHINFVIQRGEKGDKGDMGDSGNATYNYYYYYSSCECPPPDLSGYIQEAPNDGQPYVRINGGWSPLYNYAT